MLRFVGCVVAHAASTALATEGGAGSDSTLGNRPGGGGHVTEMEIACPGVRGHCECPYDCGNKQTCGCAEAVACCVGEPLEPQAAATCPESLDGYVAEYQFIDITKSGGTEIADGDWTGPTEWNHDDGWLGFEIPFAFPWYGLEETAMAIGTNGLIMFGTGQLQAQSSPIPSTLLSPAATDENPQPAVGVDGLVAPFWADINPGSSLDGVDENGAVYYQIFQSSVAVQWDQCTYWTPDNNPTASTFQAVLWHTGGVFFAYETMQQEAGHLSWMEESIGYEDASGTNGVQLSYSEIPADHTAYYIPPVCTARGAAVATREDEVDCGLESLSANVNAACCGEGGVLCERGIPASCDAQCAAVLRPLFTVCGASFPPTVVMLLLQAVQLCGDEDIANCVDCNGH